MVRLRHCDSVDVVVMTGRRHHPHSGEHALDHGTYRIIVDSGQSCDGTFGLEQFEPSFDLGCWRLSNPWGPL